MRERIELGHFPAISPILANPQGSAQGLQGLVQPLRVLELPLRRMPDSQACIGRLAGLPVADEVGGPVAQHRPKNNLLLLRT